MLLVVLNALLIWVATGPRTLGRALPYIESALTPTDGSFRVHINEALLLWDGWRHPLDIRLHGVDVLTPDGARFATFPDISVGLDLVSLPLGEFVPTSLIIRHPVISLLRQEDGRIRFGFADTQAPEKVQENAAVAALLDDFTHGALPEPLHKLKHLQIEEADVSVGDAKQGMLMRAQAVNLSLKRRGPRLETELSATIAREGMPAYLGVTMSSDKDTHSLLGTLKLQNIWPADFAPLLPEMPWLAELQLPLTGMMMVQMDEKAQWHAPHMLLSSPGGTINSPLFEKPIAVSDLQVEAHAPDVNSLQVDKLGLQLGGAPVAGQFTVMMQDGQPGVTGSIGLRGAKVDDVRLYWPVMLAPESRDWVVKNVRGGQITESVVTMNIAPGDFAKPALPKAAINSQTHFSDTTIRYLPDHPEVTHAQGMIQVDGESLQVTANKAGWASGTRIANAVVTIADLNVDNPRIELRLDAEGPAADIVQFLSLPPAQHAQRLHLDRETVKGNVRGTANVAFYYTAPRDEKGRPREDLGIEYAVQAQLDQVTQPGFLGRYDIAGAQGVVKADNAALTFSGTGTVNTVPATAQLEYRFQPKDGLDTLLNVTAAAAPVSALAKFGYGVPKGVGGTAGVKAQIRLGPQRQEVDASLDLKNARVRLEDFDWEKPPGQPSTLDVTMKQQGSDIALAPLRFTAPDTLVSGTMLVSEDFATLRAADLETMRLGENDLALHYAAGAEGYVLHLKGATANAAPWMKGSGEFSFKTFPAVDAQFDVRTMKLSDAKEIHDLTGTLKCTKIFCQSANLHGKVEKGDAFSVQIAPDAQGRRSLAVHTTNAGAFLDATDIYNSMRGGDLALEGVYDDGAPGRPLSGTLVIGPHVIENAPVLAQLLTLASLTGFVDTLQGKGIAFTRLQAPFTLADDVITLKEAKTFGPAVGMSAEGKITFPGEKLDIKGTVVPSYMLNTVLGKVPLIGDMLTGGGEGIIGARYAIRGPAEEAKVSVNPLSILTPGFLRGVFDVFDKPAKPDEPAQKTDDVNKAAH